MLGWRGIQTIGIRARRYGHATRGCRRAYRSRRPPTVERCYSMTTENKASETHLSVERNNEHSFVLAELPFRDDETGLREQRVASAVDHDLTHTTVGTIANVDVHIGLLDARKLKHCRQSPGGWVEVDVGADVVTLHGFWEVLLKGWRGHRTRPGSLGHARDCKVVRCGHLRRMCRRGRCVGGARRWYREW